MLKDRAREYFLEKDFNCAEAALRAIRDEYGLEISEDDLKLVSAFGGGMGCGQACGVLCGCLAAYGKMTVEERAHITTDFGEKCGELCKEFASTLGSIQCSVLREQYRTPEERCLKTVELGLDVFDKYISK